MQSSGFEKQIFQIVFLRKIVNMTILNPLETFSRSTYKAYSVQQNAISIYYQHNDIQIMTLRMMTLIIMTQSITKFTIMTLHNIILTFCWVMSQAECDLVGDDVIVIVIVLSGIWMCHCDECHYSECHNVVRQYDEMWWVALWWESLWSWPLWWVELW